MIIVLPIATPEIVQPFPYAELSNISHTRSAGTIPGNTYYTTVSLVNVSLSQAICQHELWEWALADYYNALAIIVEIWDNTTIVSCYPQACVCNTRRLANPVPVTCYMRYWYQGPIQDSSTVSHFVPNIANVITVAQYSPIDPSIYYTYYDMNYHSFYDHEHHQHLFDTWSSPSLSAFVSIVFVLLIVVIIYVLMFEYDPCAPTPKDGQRLPATAPVQKTQDKLQYKEP